MAYHSAVDLAFPRSPSRSSVSVLVPFTFTMQPTKFYVAGLTMREIAETLAWEEESVETIIRRYVGRSAAIKARIRKLEARE